MKTVTITNVEVFATAPEKISLVVVRVSTSEPGLYGVGCATFTQRYLAVMTAVEKYLKPFLIGKDAARIEDIWQTSMVSSYWRNGPVLNNAIAGVDMALWDIKGKMAGMPLYDLFGGKSREAAAAYTHVDGATIEEVIDCAHKTLEQGYINIRLQCGGYGGIGMPGNKTVRRKQPIHAPEGALPGAYFNPKAYMKTVLALFERARVELGDEVNLCHDVHERLTPVEALAFAKKMEQFDLLFLEDALAPEQVDWFAKLRDCAQVPLAMGELFVNSDEWLYIIRNRLIDFIRVHLSMIGGITPTLKLTSLCHAFGIRTAWHGPGDLSPIGAAVNAHVDIWAPNFGVQEWFNGMTDASLEVFPGAPEFRDGYIYVNDKPGIGVDFNEKAAARYPCDDTLPSWTLTRLPDGTSVRP